MELEQLFPLESQPALDVVVTTVPSDSHTWNLVFLQLLLLEQGHDVVNLGPCVPNTTLIEYCIDNRPDLVVVSSVNGHGFPDGMRLIAELRAQPLLSALPVVIGGKLGIRAEENVQYVEHLIEGGFDAVFEDGGGLRAFTSFVESLPVSVG
ncbi:methylaspartate mutase [Amycolatopsis antarctica]|uniref:Methylaspartate mutase n=1 Tax=Amycolatopsis antarctica TaxID=1854586 RepID=A0A263D511_9PSEU|nr:cobalamin-dependent protein [Amycolatopsis antarctica]OZM73289.1 methylaspartate mutase [Amycolatopsis antarctica]